MTRRPIGSFTYTRPSDSTRMLLTMPSFSIAVAVTAPSCRIGGRPTPLLCAPAAVDATAVPSANDNDFIGVLIAGITRKRTGTSGHRDIGTSGHRDSGL